MYLSFCPANRNSSEEHDFHVTLKRISLLFFSFFLLSLPTWLKCPHDSNLAMTMKLKINLRNEGVKITSVWGGCRTQLPPLLSLHIRGMQHGKGRNRLGCSQAFADA